MANTRSKFSSYWGHGYWGRLEIPSEVKRFEPLENHVESWSNLTEEDKLELSISLSELTSRKGCRLGYLLFAPIGGFIAMFVTGLIMLLFGIDGPLFGNELMVWVLGITYFSLGMYFLRD